MRCSFSTHIGPVRTPRQASRPRRLETAAIGGRRPACRGLPAIARHDARRDFLYFVNADDEYRLYRVGKDGEDLRLLSQDAWAGRIQQAGPMIAYTAFTENHGFVEGCWFCRTDGSGKRAFGD